MILKNPVENELQSTEAAPEVIEGAQEVINVSGYRFVEIENLLELQADMRADLGEIGIKGTILIATEGINAALAGSRAQVKAVKNWFEQDTRFANLWLKESASEILPFAKLKVRIRPEIITFQPDSANPVSPAQNPAPAMSPAKLKQMLDANEDFTLLDTRNAYEVESGTFESAIDLRLRTFRDLTDAVTTALDSGELDRDKPVVTFCTGGIRCEKAAPYLIEQGFKEVYQVEGGILNYFEECGDAHWQGECFVFDDRVEINPALEPTGARMCRRCHRAIPAVDDTCICERVTPPLPPLR